MIIEYGTWRLGAGCMLLLLLLCIAHCALRLRSVLCVYFYLLIFHLIDNVIVIAIGFEFSLWVLAVLLVYY